MSWQQSAAPDRRGLILGILAAGALATFVLFSILMWFLMPLVGSLIMEIPIRTDAPKDMFPDYWNDGKIKPKAKALGSFESTRAKLILNKALHEYPTPLLKLNLAEVHCVSDLQFYSRQSPHESSIDKIYIHDDGYADAWLAQCLHLEVGRIFSRNYAHIFKQKEWDRLLPKGFTYGLDKEPEGEASRDAGYREEAWLSKGFVSIYSAYDQESDFGFLAEGIMTGCSDFYSHAAKHPVLKKKGQLIVDLYRTLGIDLPLWDRQFGSGLKRF